MRGAREGSRDKRIVRSWNNNCPDNYLPVPAQVSMGTKSVEIRQKIGVESGWHRCPFAQVREHSHKRLFAGFTASSPHRLPQQSAESESSPCGAPRERGHSAACVLARPRRRLCRRLGVYAVHDPGQRAKGARSTAPAEQPIVRNEDNLSSPKAKEPEDELLPAAPAQRTNDGLVRADEIDHVLGGGFSHPAEQTAPSPTPVEDAPPLPPPPVARPPLPNRRRNRPRRRSRIRSQRNLIPRRRPRRNPSR